VTTVSPYLVHPKVEKTKEELLNRLAAIDPDLDEVVLMARIIVRKGVPRKVKWSLEEEVCV